MTDRKTFELSLFDLYIFLYNNFTVKILQDKTNEQLH